MYLVHTRPSPDPLHSLGRKSATLDGVFRQYFLLALLFPQVHGHYTTRYVFTLGIDTDDGRLSHDHSRTFKDPPENWAVKTSQPGNI